MEKFEYINNKIILKNEKNKEIGYVLFNLENNIFTIISTFVNDEFKGKGYAKKLMNETERYVKEYNYKLKLECSYSIKYFSNVNDIEIIK